MYTVCKPGFLRPVKTISKAMVCPLCVIVLRHQIDFTVILTHFPILGRYACPGLGSVSLKHILGKFKECAVLGVRPCIQPVGSGTNQVNGSVHTGQCQVVVGKIICPGNEIGFQFCVYLLCKDSV